MNKPRQEAQQTKSVIQDIKHQRDYRRRRINSNRLDDRYQNGELLVAAGMLIAEATKRQQQQDMLKLGKAYEECKTYVFDYNKGNVSEQGMPSYSDKPPPGWPLTEGEWISASISHDGVITQAGALLVAERERRDRLHGHLYRNGTNGLDDEYRELQTQRAEIAEKKLRNSWKQRAKDNEKTAKGQLPDAIRLDSMNPVAYAGTSTPDMSNTLDQSRYIPDLVCEPEPYDFDDLGVEQACGTEAGF